MYIMKIMSNKKNKLRILIPILIGCTILIGTVWKIGVTNVWSSISMCNPHFLVVAVIILSLSIILKSFRWVTLFIDVKTIDACKVYLIGQIVNEIAPIGVGEATRIYMAKSKFGIPAGKTTVLVVIERVADTTFLLAMAIPCLMMFIGGIHPLQIAVPVVILLIGYTILLKPKLLHSVITPLIKLKSKREIVRNLISKISRFLKSLEQSVNLPYRRRILLQVSVITIVAWCVEALGQSIILRALGMEIQIFYMIIIIATAWILGTFSFLPGGLGAREVVFSFLLNTQGIPLTIGMATALIYRGITYLLLGSSAFASLVSITKLH